jgi:hypothetical protein
LLVVVVGGISVVLRHRISGDRILTVDPPGKVLKLAALAAERLPRRLRKLASTEHAGARNHGHIL